MQGPTRVLVVDDDASVREFLLAAVCEAGYDAVEAVDGLEALELVRVRRFDMIVLDWQMPRMDGGAFLDAYAGLPGPHAAVILCTALPVPVKGSGIVLAGYLRKPFGLHELYQALQNCRHT